MKPIVLVAGATGMLGSEICHQLVEKGFSVRALVRKTSDPVKIKRLKSLGCKTVEGDLKEPKSLAQACQGVQAIISTATSSMSRQEGDSIETVDHHGQLSLISAARQSKVPKFVFISFPEMIYQPNALDTAKRTAEQHLKKSGMDYTSLQANFFMEVWLSPALGFDYPNRKARIYGEGSGKSSWISLNDVARFAVASLDHPAAKNKILRIGGPEALSPKEVTALFEKAVGRKFEVEKVPVTALIAQQQQATDPLQKAFASLMLAYAEGWPMEMTQLSKEFGLTLTSVEVYARQVMGKRRMTAV